MAGSAVGSSYMVTIAGEAKWLGVGQLRGHPVGQLRGHDDPEHDFQPFSLSKNRPTAVQRLLGTIAQLLSSSKTKRQKLKSRTDETSSDNLTPSPRYEQIFNSGDSYKTLVPSQC